MNRSFSIPEWHRTALEGSAPPVRIQLNGGSMHPLIRWNRDFVTIIPMKGLPVVGDIVLFCEPVTKRYVVHRVWQVDEEKALTWGDICARPDGWIPFEAIWGKIVLIERGKRKIKPDPRKGIIWAKFWHQGGKVYRPYKRCKAGIMRRIRKRKA